MPRTQFYIHRDISVPHDGVHSLDVLMNNATLSGTAGKVVNCQKEFMTMVCQVFGTVNT
jgi:hypothetical protein